MQPVLLDTSALLDLAIFYQVRHRRNRYIASSAAAALECSIFYPQVLIDSYSIARIQRKGFDSRYVEFYCDTESQSLLDDLQVLGEVISALEIDNASRIRAYERALGLIEQSIATIENPDDLRAYELYDYLPYHLGEDPTAIECGVYGPAVANLNSLECPDAIMLEAINRVNMLLESRNHPIRAAWALPLLQLFFYVAIQDIFGVNYVPHCTKSTIAFGRESETVKYKRIVDYFQSDFQAKYNETTERELGGDLLRIEVPGLSDSLLCSFKCFQDLWGAVKNIRELSSTKRLQEAFEGCFDALPNKEFLCELEKEISVASRELASDLGIRESTKKLHIGVPFGRVRNLEFNGPYMIVHSIFVETGLSRF